MINEASSGANAAGRSLERIAGRTSFIRNTPTPLDAQQCHVGDSGTNPTRSFPRRSQAAALIRVVYKRGLATVMHHETGLCSGTRAKPVTIHPEHRASYQWLVTSEATDLLRCREGHCSMT
jgi:hypothetical protein